MRKFFGSIAIAVALSGCIDTHSREQAEALQQKVESQAQELAHINRRLAEMQSQRDALQEKVEELSQTPSVLFARVSEAVNKRDAEAARLSLETMRKRYPGAAETVGANKLVVTLAATLEAEKKEAERLASMGFRALPSTGTVSIGSVRLAAGRPSTARNFNFDRHDDSYRYVEADRGNQYIRLPMSVTADQGEDDPRLPGMALYRAEGSRLIKVSDFETRFARWDDFASYIGNDPDYGNDFAKTATVRFELGAEVPTPVLSQKPLYIVSTTTGCLSRFNDRFGRPPVRYSGTCHSLQSNLTILDFTGNRASVTLVRRMD